MTPPLSRFLRRAWPSLTLIVGTLVVHARELLGARPMFRDVHQVYVPAKHFLAERLRAGEFPQWFPYDGGGSPFLAQPIFSAFHPTTLLYAVLPFWPAFLAQEILATMFAALGAYRLARELSAGRGGAVVAGALYAFSGYLMSLTEHTFMKLSASTMPWYLAALLLARRRGGWTYLLPVLAMGLLLLAGDPQMALMASAFGLALLLAKPPGRRARDLAIAFISPAIGALLAMVQLVPSLLVVANTERGHGLDSVRWSLPFTQLLGLFAPIDHGPNEWAHSTLFGLAGVALVVVAIVLSPRRRIVIALSTLAIISIWLALGDGAVLNAIAKSVVPLWGRFRYPMKAIVVAYLALALLAGLGFSRLRRSGRVVPLAGGLSLLGGVVAWSLHPELAVLPMLALVGTLALVVVERGRLAMFAIVLQTAFLAGETWPTVPAAEWEPSPLVASLQQAGVGLEGPTFDRPIDRLDADDWFASDVACVGGGGISLSALWGLPTLSPSMPGVSWRVLRLFGEPYRTVMNERLIGVFGVGYVVMRAPIEERLLAQVIGAEPRFGYRLLKLRKTLPRAYAVHRARPAASAEEAMSLLIDPAFKPGREIILEGEARADAATRPDQPAVPAIVAARERTNEVRVRAELPWPGFIVFNEAAFPGWTATLDGQPAPIQVANAFVRAVEAEAGAHEVLFRYETPGLVVGAWISIAAWVALVVGWVALRRRGTSPHPTERPTN